jgi:hypothetical protein
MERAALAFPRHAVSALAPLPEKTWLAAAWIRYGVLLALAAMPVLHPVLGLNPIYAVFVLAALLDALSRPRLSMLVVLAILPIAVRFDWMGWIGWCLLLPQFRWFVDSPRRAAAMLCLWFGVYLSRGYGLQAWIFCGIFGYCMFVLDSLPRRQEIRTSFSVPVLLQLALGILSLLVLEFSSTERFWFAVNPNIDSILVGALLAILGCELLGLFSVALLFRSRSGLLSVLFRFTRLKPRGIHLAVVAMIPFIVASIAEFLPRSADVPEGPARLLAINDGSNEHRRGSLVSAITWIGEHPHYLLGSDDQARGVYLFYNDIFPHNAFAFSIMNDGLLVFLAFLLFTWSAYDRMRPAGRLMVLSILAGVGFSDIGFDFEFVIAIISAGLLMDWRAKPAAESDGNFHGH